MSYWGLSEIFVQRYSAQGITALYDWQVGCMDQKAVLREGNPVYSVRTGRCKTLIAEILILRNIFMTQWETNVFILLFASIVVDKVRYLVEQRLR